jgi:predicted phosphodiesterase
MDEAQMIEALQARGFSVVKEQKVEPRIKLANLKAKRFRIGVISDTHLGSMFHQRTYMNEFCDAFVREGCEAILHAGDLVHGSSNMHKGMEFEVAIHGAHAQTAYAVENFPRTGLPVYIIDGNHDLSFLKDAGAYVVRDFADKRDDVTYLGSEGAYFEIGGASIYLWHGGSSSYAKSYNLQKWAEAVAPEEKPHVVLDGHLHFQCHVHHRGIECFQLPCLQAQTPFEKRKRLHPVVGALILDLWVSRNGLEDVQTRWMVRRAVIPNDY